MEQVDHQNMHGRSPIVTADTRYSGSSSSLTPAMCNESSSLLPFEWSTRSLCKLRLWHPQLPAHISQRLGFHLTSANLTAYYYSQLINDDCRLQGQLALQSAGASDDVTHRNRTQAMRSYSASLALLTEVTLAIQHSYASHLAHSW